MIIQVKGISKDYYVMFNLAAGINSDVVEGRNKVMVTSRDNISSRAVSLVVAELDSGDAYSIPGTSYKVKVVTINLVASSPFAQVEVSSPSSPIGTPSTSAPVSPTKTPTISPTSNPPNEPTSLPTKIPVSNPINVPVSFPTKLPTIDPDTTRFVGNFDSTDQATYVFSSGTYEIKTSPDPLEINQSSLAVRYVRNFSYRYDYITYEISSSLSSLDLDAFINGNKKMCIDVLTSASQTLIGLQLEDSNRAGSFNYPSGRHSRYTIDVQSSSSWKQYCFQLLDRPDSSVDVADTMILFIDPNAFANNEYYFDNFDSIGVDATSVPTLALTEPPTSAPMLSPITSIPSLASKPTLNPTPSPTSSPTKKKKKKNKKKKKKKQKKNKKKRRKFS